VLYLITQYYLVKSTNCEVHFATSAVSRHFLPRISLHEKRSVNFFALYRCQYCFKVENVFPDKACFDIHLHISNHNLHVEVFLIVFSKRRIFDSENIMLSDISPPPHTDTHTVFPLCNFPLFTSLRRNIDRNNKRGSVLMATTVSYDRMVFLTQWWGGKLGRFFPDKLSDTLKAYFNITNYCLLQADIKDCYTNVCAGR
jgi:hypothetical protein